MNEHRPAPLPPAVRDLLTTVVRFNPEVNTEVFTEPVRVWVIAAGEYAERTPVAVVHGTEDDARREADRYNAEVPWTHAGDRAEVWTDVPFIGPAGRIAGRRVRFPSFPPMRGPVYPGAAHVDTP